LLIGRAVSFLVTLWRVFEDGVKLKRLSGEPGKTRISYRLPANDNETDACFGELSDCLIHEQALGFLAPFDRSIPASTD